MDTKDLPMAKRMLEENISLAINQLRNKFKVETGIEVESIQVNFMEAYHDDGRRFYLLDGVECKLSFD